MELERDQEPSPDTVHRVIRKIVRRSYPLILTSAFFIPVVWFVVGYLWEPPVSEHWNDRGPIGDAMAPFTALLTAAALFWSIRSIGMQREELRLQREELRAQHEERKASREALQEQAAAQRQQVQAQQRMERAYLLLANTTQLGHLLAYWQKYVDAEEEKKRSTRARGQSITQQRHGEIMARLHQLDKETKAALAALATASTETETEGDAD